jgi:hypothetical protein
VSKGLDRIKKLYALAADVGASEEERRTASLLMVKEMTRRNIPLEAVVASIRPETPDAPESPTVAPTADAWWSVALKSTGLAYFVLHDKLRRTVSLQVQPLPDVLGDPRGFTMTKAESLILRDIVRTGQRGIPVTRNVRSESDQDAGFVLRHVWGQWTIPLTDEARKFLERVL